MTLRMITPLATGLVWVALWGDLTAANLFVGMGFGVVLLAVRKPDRIRRVRLWPALQLLGLLLADLALSTVSVTRHVLMPAHRREPDGLIEVRLQGGQVHHSLLLTCAVTLTPGSAVARVTTAPDDPTAVVLTVHLLQISDATEVRGHIARMASLADDAFGVQALGAVT